MENPEKQGMSYEKQYMKNSEAQYMKNSEKQ